MFYQIASLKAALAKKEESVPMKHKEMSSPCGMQPSPIQSNPQKREILGDSNVQRRPMDDVGNIEVESLDLIVSRSAIIYYTIQTLLLKNNLSKFFSV